MTWRVARSLDTLLAEINAAAPNRSKISDGSIGDAAHASRTSDHNPWISVAGIGIVRARDFTHDPANGCDGYDLAPALANLLRRHPALGTGAYVIWQRRIISADRLSEGWRPYSGSNPHDHHVHISVTTSAAGFDSTAPWGVMTNEDDMPTPDETRKIVREEIDSAEDRIAAAVVKRLLGTDLTPKNDEKDTTVRGALNKIANSAKPKP